MCYQLKSMESNQNDMQELQACDQTNCDSNLNESVDLAESVDKKESVDLTELIDETELIFEYEPELEEKNLTDSNEDEDEYKYTKIDCLDEDTPIPGQQYVLMSFISPERIMNCDIRGIKIRGVFASREKAEKALETLKNKDKYFDIWLGEVGKWLPWNPNTSQVEEVKYRNKKLDKIMNKVHKTELETLNELVGRRKEQLDTDKIAHKDRQKNNIKESVKNYGTNESKNESEQPNETQNSQKSNKPKQHNKDAIKQRLRKTLEKRAEAKVATDDENQSNQNENKKVAELKMTSEEIQGKLDRMKEYMKNRQTR